jgi:hypothetical protein
MHGPVSISLFKDPHRRSPIGRVVIEKPFIKRDPLILDRTTIVAYRFRDNQSNLGASRSNPAAEISRYLFGRDLLLKSPYSLAYSTRSLCVVLEHLTQVPKICKLDPGLLWNCGRRPRDLIPLLN